jgi:predicted alpha/beta-fold hydrolase
LLHKFEEVPAPFDASMLTQVEGIRELDGKYTVPMHGFTSVDEYYTHASSRQYLRSIRVPTLLLQAKDDPFMTEEVIPEKNELSPYVRLEVTEAGGHVGFVSGTVPWKPHYWLEERVPEFLKLHL